ncbi:phage minor structural protein [Gemella haemolysans]|uniref:Phage minor structural protein n=1 Tax=Gemella haemolysans TaxID=1379 RepID=A0A133ZZW7_9BACL|nr:phage tail spike protein [Gemella haemolysans]KXB60975.1 phage minor structural protein [Gemella haemolysans]
MLWLYDEFETDFTYNGIVLNNAYDSDIHWVLNTMYKLTFKYPTVDNDLYSFIEKGMIVKADEHDRTNLFRIKDIDISENDKCITVTAYQKNYDFSKRLVNNFGRLRVNCMSVLDEWYSNFLSSEKDFSYYSDINAINSFVSHNDDTDNKLRTSFELLGGIADTYSADIDMHDKQISLLERLGRDTEEVLTTAKNISEFVNTSNSDEIVTRIYASSTFKVGDKYDKKDLREQHRQQLKALRESQKEYSQGRNAVKIAEQMKDEIAKKYAKELAKNNKKVKRSGKVIKSYSQIESEVNAKYQERERKSQQRKAESQAIADRKKAEIESLKAQQKEELEALDEEITINLIVESPLINDYPFINEIAVSNNDLRTAEELEEWAMEYFTKQNIDKPKNSIKVTYEQLSEDINRGDTVILKYLKYGVDERIRVVETHYDPILKKWKEFILGEKEGRLGSEVSNASSGAIAKANAYTDIITMDIERKVKERSENYDKLFKKNTDEINKKIEDGFEKAKASSEVITAKIDENLEKKLAPIRNQVSITVENYNRQFQATNLEITKNRVEATKQIQAANLEISKNRVEATKQIQALSDRVNNMQDISSNSTVVELKKLVNEAKETGKNINQKVTELEGNVTREFSSVKAKNENDLKVIRGEIKAGVDGLTSKISSLEEYKNQDGSRNESLKQWVQRDTASQLSRERTEINRVIDSKGFVKNTEFSSKFTENARGITNQLTALENYKNQDGVRTANLQIWVQNNTANQLTTERRNIESWVDDKGYATTSVVENKVQETANSISREIRNIRESIPTSVGGRNYITDSEKLQSKPHWGSNKWDETVDGDTIILTKKGGSDNTGFFFALTDLVKTQFQNETLTWSIDVKASRDMTLNTVGFETNGLRRVDISTQWKRMSHTFINKFTNFYAFVFYHPTTNFNNGDKIYIRLPKLEKGNVATDWTPAPEENNAFVKNTEFSNKFNENAQGINRQLTALEQYKNQDGARVANMQIWAQNNTANQLTAARRSIESWVNEKGYATTSVVENKVQETANSFSREISNVRNSIPTSVGGRNYILNSNFAKELENWEMARLNNSGLNWQKGHAIQNFGRGLHIWGTPNGDYKGLGTMFNLTAKQGEKLTLSMDLGKDALTQNAILYIGLHYVVDNDIVSQQWQPLDLATQNFEVKKYKRISKTFTVTADMNKCRLMIHTQNNKLINFYIDNIKLEKGDISTDWTPAPEDVEQNVNELNTWKQTTNQTLNTVTSTLNDTVRHAQLRIGADGIDFGSNKVFNGRNLASILSVSPESIQAITDRLVISPANENLVKREYRDTFILNVRNGVLNRIYGSNVDLVGEYQFKVAIIDFDTPTLNASIHVKYKDGTDSWFNSEFPTPSIATLETSTSVKVQVESRKEIEYIEPLVFQNKWSDFYRFHLKKLFVGKKKSAELIVDGSIEGRQIKAETLETGHHKAGSITSEIIAANAVKAKHILIDDGLINNLVTHNAFISKLWAQDAFIRSLKTVKISTTQLDTDWLSAYTGDIGGFRIGKNPNQPGDFWLTGSNNFNCGLNPGHNIGTRGAQIWAAWGYNWNQAGPNAWWVDGQGRMNCKGSATFYGGLHVYNARLDTHGQDIQGDANSNGAKTTVIWWSQINRVKSSVSDKRFKTNIKPTKVKAVDLLNKIEMVEFNWKKDNKFEKIGAIAQQVQSVEESLVVKDMDSKQSHSDYLRISYYDTIPYLIKAVQELSEENNKLKNKLEGIING